MANIFSKKESFPASKTGFINKPATESESSYDAKI